MPAAGGGGAAIRSEAAIVRRAWVTLAIESAAAVAAVLVILGALGYAVVLHEQQTFVTDQLARAAGTADLDDIKEPPADVSLFLLGADGREVASSPGAPPGLPDRAGTRATRGHPASSTIELRGVSFRTYTVERGAGWVQAAFDLGPQQSERQRLLGAGVVVGITGILLAGFVGALLGRRSVKPLGDALARQSRFVADASHELRTPLTLLRTRAQLLARDAAAGQLDRVEAETVALSRDAERLGEVIDDLLVSAELGGGRGRREVVDLGALVAEVADAARAHAREAGVSVDTDLCNARVSGAPTALRRVVASLLDNAIHHAPRGGHVGLRVEQHERDVMLEVSDDGDGFDPAQAQQLFERFVRGNGAAGGRRYGLGLALVREVVAAHGGQVRAEGRPGAGATFRVLLPPA